jgi:TPR repeat protein
MRFANSIVLLCGLLSSGVAFGQQKPLRERLLERAQQGDVEAQYDLAKNLEAGRLGLKRDFTQAEHWYRKAAEQGDPFAQAGLGILYQFGKGVKADPVEALMWYTLAAAGTKGGDRDSIAEMLNNLSGEMSPEQRSEARKRASEWKPTK